MNEPSKDVIASFELAKQLRRPWEPRWQRLVELAMPYRTYFFDVSREGLPPMVTIYDDTGQTALEEMAARLQTGIMPSGVEWAGLQADRAKGDALKAGLAAVQKEMFEQLDRSNFGAEITDTFKDLSGFGNGCIRLSSGDWHMPVRAMAIPLPNAWVTPGPDGLLGDVHVLYRMPAYTVAATWPDAVIPKEILESDGRNKLRIIDSWVRDLHSPTESWLNELHVDGKTCIRRKVVGGAGACPYIFGRWSKAAGELYASGQGMLALPSMEVLNEMRRLILAHGEMALSGMYQAEDDGVLNPWTIKLEPGVIIPKAPGSQGLTPLAPPGGKVDLGLMELKELRMGVKKTLYNEQLGPRDGTTPPTAFEIQERMNDLMRQIGPAYHRVWNEMAIPILIRTRRILLDQGRIIMPLIDGKTVKVVASSSMVKAQAMAEVQRVKQYLSDIGTFYGPQAVQTLTSAERFARYAEARYDVPAGIAFTDEEVAANAQRMGQLAGQAAAGGTDLAPLLGALGVGK